MIEDAVHFGSAFFQFRFDALLFFRETENRHAAADSERRISAAVFKNHSDSHDVPGFGIQQGETGGLDLFDFTGKIFIGIGFGPEFAGFAEMLVEVCQFIVF